MFICPAGGRRGSKGCQVASWWEEGGEIDWRRGEEGDGRHCYGVTAGGNF